MTDDMIPLLSDWLNAVLTAKQQLGLLHIVIGLSVLFALARPVMAAATRLADHTATKVDNNFLQVVSTILDWLGIVYDIARRVTPHMQLGPLPSREPITTRMSRRPPSVLIAPPPIEVPPPATTLGLLPAAPIGSTVKSFGALNPPIIDDTEITRRTGRPKKPTA